MANRRDMVYTDKDGTLMGVAFVVFEGAEERIEYVIERPPPRYQDMKLYSVE